MKSKTPDPEAADAEPSNVITLATRGKDDQKKAKERWSASVMERGYAMVPTILLWGQARLGLSPDELNVLLQLLSHWWYAGTEPHPTKATIATRMGKHPRTIQTYLTRLEERGFLRRVVRRRPGKGQDANGYDLSPLVQKLTALAPEFKKVADQNRRRSKRVEAAS